VREREVAAALVKRINRLGGEVRKVKWVGLRSSPDRVVMIAPHLTLVASNTVWVELKATGEECTLAQKREHTRMRRAYQTVIVIDSQSGVDLYFPLTNED